MKFFLEIFSVASILLGYFYSSYLKNENVTVFNVVVVILLSLISFRIGIKNED